jgi:hypothetical protein
VAEANARSGGSACYFVNVTGHSGYPVDEAFQAKEAGAGGVLLMPGLMGFGVVQALSRDKSFDLPIMTHPSFTGPYVLTPETGISHASCMVCCSGSPAPTFRFSPMSAAASDSASTSACPSHRPAAPPTASANQ